MSTCANLCDCAVHFGANGVALLKPQRPQGKTYISKLQSPFPARTCFYRASNHCRRNFTGCQIFLSLSVCFCFTLSLGEFAFIYKLFTTVHVHLSYLSSTFLGQRGVFRYCCYLFNLGSPFHIYQGICTVLYLFYFE